jgi:hypothetical protein
MRKSIILTLVAVLALAIAGIGGVFADYQDIEVSQDNFFSTGSMNLKVSDETGNVWDGPDVIPALFEISAAGGAFPCCSKDIRLDLHAELQGQAESAVCYIHFKNIECAGIEKVEPEIAVEEGGIIGELADGTLVYSPGIGEYGENCELSEHVDISIFTGPSIGGPWEPVDLSDYDENDDGIIKMNEIECEQIPLVELFDCTAVYVMITLHLQDVPEEYLDYDLFDETDPAEAKWNDWPTNALMKDRMYFDMSFELFQNWLPTP